MHPPRVQVKTLSKSIFERRNQLQGFYDYFLKHHTSMWFFIEKKKQTLETIPIKLRKLNGNQQGLVELCHRLYISGSTFLVIEFSSLITSEIYSFS